MSSQRLRAFTLADHKKRGHARKTHGDAEAREERSFSGKSLKASVGELPTTAQVELEKTR